MINTSPFLELAQKQVELFQQDNIAWMECLVTCECTKSIMGIGYNSLVRQKEIIPIEKMPESERKNLWEQAKDFAKDRLDKEGLIKMCKGLLTLEYLLRQSV